MGTWGTGLYQDDTTCDIKEDYLDLLKVGMSKEEALKKIDAVNADSVAEIIDRVLDSSTMCISAVGPVNNVENLFELD